MKFEAARIHFLGDVFDAVAIFVTTDTVNAKLERILFVTTPLQPIFFLPTPPPSPLGSHIFYYGPPQIPPPPSYLITLMLIPRLT